LSNILEVFIKDLEKTWEASWLLAEGLNIRRETGELISILRMLDGRFWKVYVYNKRSGVNKAYVKLTLKEAVELVHRHIREIDGRHLEKPVNLHNE